jgi:hypothetical protein
VKLGALLGIAATMINWTALWRAFHDQLPHRDAEQPVEFLGDGEVLAADDLDVRQVQQVLAMATAWEDASPADNGSDAVVRALRAALGLS